MSVLSRLSGGVRALLRRSRQDEDLDDEVRSFLEASIAEKRAAGMDSESARRAALCELGSTAAIRDWTRDVGWNARVEGNWLDMRHAFRVLAHSPGFTVAAVLILALAIGATTAIFTLVNAVILHPLAILDADRVIAVEQRSTFGGRRFAAVSTYYETFLEIRATTEGLADWTIEGDDNVTLVKGVESSAAVARFIGPNYFDVLRQPPAVGRRFVAADDDPGAALVVILSDLLWRRTYGANPQVIGQPIRVSGGVATIVGVAPPRVRGTDISRPADLFLPAHAILRTTSMPGDPGNYYFQNGAPGYAKSPMWRVIGRLRTGVEPQTIEAHITCAGCLALPSSTALGIIPIQHGAVLLALREEVARFSGFLFAAVAMVLLIGCANLAGLVMVRTEARRREIAVRLAMGMGRARLVRQLLFESLGVALMGGVAGLLVARALLDSFSGFELPGAIALARLDYSLDPRIVFFALGVSALTAIAFGIAPAWTAARTDVVTALKLGGTAPRRMSRLRFITVAVQVALTLMLVCGTGLFVRSLQRALAVDVGVETGHVLLADVDVRAMDKAGSDTVAFVSDLASRIRQATALTSVSFGGGPFFAGGSSTPWVVADGQEYRLEQNVSLYSAGPGYFSTLAVRLLQGRDIAPSDRAAAPAVVVVNAAFARRFWPAGEPLGHRVSLRPWITNAEIVGVAEDGKYRTLTEEGRLVVFAPYAQTARHERQPAIIVRTSGDAHSLADRVRAEMARADPAAPRARVDTLRDRIASLMMSQQFGAWLLGGLAVLALGLSLIGVYGLVAYVVALRRHEFAVRVALGADRSDIVRLVLGSSLRSTLVGALAGIGGVALLGRYAAVFLFGVTPTDPMTLILSAAVLALAALAASAVPVRRAMLADPVSALRAE